ncbi:MAG TPA: hypothetical protein VFN23_10115 [Ktedonobacteraceae bacterium]|nr:hypothetical protein [Ktedonobacteraceae bacterium]
MSQEAKKYLYTLNFESPGGARGTHLLTVTEGAPELVQQLDDFLSKAPGFLILSLHLHDAPIYDASLEEVIIAQEQA